MLKSLTAFPVLTVVFGCLLTACLSDKETEIVVSNDCMVTHVKLGKLNRNIYTRTADGTKDSVYVQSVPAGLYELTIDQHNNIIYNVDSLPCNTNVRRVALAAFAARGGVTIRSLTSGRDTLFSISDSTDFSRPREITIHGEDGISKRVYTIELRVHREEGDSSQWKLRSPEHWELQKFVTPKEGRFSSSTLTFKLENGKIFRSTDGSTWMSDAIDAADAKHLPTAGVTGVSQKMRKDKDAEEVVMYGTQGGESRIWKRNIDLTGTYDFAWTYYPVTSENPYGAPALAWPRLLSFDDGILLLGINARQEVTMLFSRDRGRTWKHHETFRLPTISGIATKLEADIDSKQYLWLRINETEVWSGTLNRLQWKKVQTIFPKSRKHPLR